MLMSSRVAPRFPIIVGIATLTIEVSMISRRDASTATKTIRRDSRDIVILTPGGRSSVLVDLDLGREPGAKLFDVLGLQVLELDPDGNALHDLGEVSRR